MSKEQHFDITQFGNRRKFPVSQETRVAFEDFARMHTQQHKPSGERRLPTPDWAVNNEKLQILLVHFMEERAGFRKKQKGTLTERLARAKQAVINQRPRLIATLDKLCNEYVTLKRLGLNPNTTDKEWNDARFQPYMEFAEGEARFVAERKRKRELEVEIEGLDTTIRISENGAADVIAAVIYLYYRTVLDSVAVGMELGLKSPHVRQILFRLFQTAAQLWPEPKQETDTAAEASKDTVVNLKTSRSSSGAFGLASAPMFAYSDFSAEPESATSDLAG